MNILDYLSLAFAGLVYFRATHTSIRDLRIWKKVVGYETSIDHHLNDNYYEYINRIGPLSMRDVRPLIFTALISVPPIAASMNVSSWIVGILLYIGVGAYLAPLTISTAADPEAGDLRFPAAFIAKWLVAKVDVYIKLLFAWGVLWLLSRIPIIGSFLATLGETAFPVITRNKFTDEVHPDAIVPVLFTAMLIIRWGSFVIHGFFMRYLLIYLQYGFGLTISFLLMNNCPPKTTKCYLVHGIRGP